MISRITIQGYKSIKDQTVDLSPINILIGGNGIGKSNFISVFSLLKNLFDHNLQTYVISKGGADILLYMGRKVTDRILIDLYFSKREGIAYNRFIAKLVEVHDRLFIESVKTAYNPDNIWIEQLHESSKWESSFKSNHYRQAFYVNSLMKGFEVYHFHDTGDKSPMKGSCDINDNSFLRCDGSNLAAFLYYLKEKHPKHFARIEHTVASISPFFDSFNLMPDRINEQRIKLEWKQKGAGDTYFNEYQLSDGTLRFICLTTLLLQPDLPETIIIDEPELGLHPTAINKLAALVRKASEKAQIIIATQSVNLIDNFKPDDIIVANKENNASVFKRLNPKELEAWLEDYSLGEIVEQNIIDGLPID